MHAEHTGPLILSYVCESYFISTILRDSAVPDTHHYETTVWNWDSRGWVYGEALKHHHGGSVTMQGALRVHAEACAEYARLAEGGA